MFSVLDLTATQDNPVREHVILVNGLQKKCVFKFGEKLELEQPEALKFSGNDGFIVYDEQGNVFTQVKEVSQGAEIGQKLAPDQVLANLTELSREALLNRAAVLPGGEVFMAKGAKPRLETVIEFITQHNKKTRQAETSVDDEDSLIDSDGMSKEEMDKLLGDA